MSDCASGAEICLRVRELHASYGDSQVLHGMDFEVPRGECVALLGRNGAGRSSTLRAILGLVGRRTGSVLLNGRETISLPSHKIARLGIAYCPEDRSVFASLTTDENLRLPPGLGDGALPTEKIYAMFPNLAASRLRLASRLSGGERQMLSIARGLRMGASVFLLDEITSGLAPSLVQSIGGLLRSLKRQGLTILLVEQNYHFAASLADRSYIVERGRVRMEVRRGGRENTLAELQKYLGV